MFSNVGIERTRVIAPISRFCAANACLESGQVVLRTDRRVVGQTVGERAGGQERVLVRHARQPSATGGVDAAERLQTIDCKEVLAKNSLHRYRREPWKNRRTDDRRTTPLAPSSATPRTAFSTPARCGRWRTRCACRSTTSSASTGRRRRVRSPSGSGSRSGSTSYHLRALAKHDLIQRVHRPGHRPRALVGAPDRRRLVREPRGDEDARRPRGDPDRHERVLPQPPGAAHDFINGGHRQRRTRCGRAGR